MKPSNFMFHVKLFLRIINMDKRAKIDMSNFINFVLIFITKLRQSSCFFNHAQLIHKLLITRIIQL